MREKSDSHEGVIRCAMINFPIKGRAIKFTPSVHITTDDEGVDVWVQISGGPFLEEVESIPFVVTVYHQDDPSDVLFSARYEANQYPSEPVDLTCLEGRTIATHVAMEAGDGWISEITFMDGYCLTVSSWRLIVRDGDRFLFRSSYLFAVPPVTIYNILDSL